MNQEEYYRLARSLIEQAGEMQPLWDRMERWLMPRMSEVEAASTRNESCSVASEAMHTLAAAFSSYITPSGMQWFKFKSAEATDNEVYKDWYARATEVTLQEFSKSNFYAEVQEAYLSRVLYGTALMLCESKRGGGLLFRNIPVGSFGIAENDEGVIDTVCRRFKFSAAQAVQRWGGNVPHDVMDAYKKPSERFVRDKFSFLHLVTPREGYTQPNGEQVPAKARAWASVYIYDGGNYPILEEDGYEEFPFLATRFLRKPGWVFGYPPAQMCRSSIISLMKLENNLDILGDLTVFPRLLTLPDEVGEIDYRAGGQTVVSLLAAEAGFPREWGTQGRISEYKERIEQKVREIKAAFYIPFLHAVTDVDRTMTATEVQARQEERVLSISPTFALLTSDMAPLLYRAFAVLFRQGAFNAPVPLQPPSLKVRANDGTESFGVNVPQVHYLGRISQAIEKSQRIGTEGLLQMAAEFVHATGDTSALDYLNTGKMFVQAAETTGAPAGSIRSEQEVKKRREERQNLEMLQAKANIAAQGAKAAKDMGLAA